MTPDKTPTDSEILDAAEDFRSQYKHGGTTFDDFDALAFARAVLAKWGSPVVAVEPVAWWIPKAEQFALADKSGDRPFAKAWEPLYAAPQPTQAQAGTVPLIDEQIRAMLNKHPPEDVCGWSYRMGIEDAELHHGIKEGGQHGDS